MKPNVYFTREIAPESLVRIYDTLCKDSDLSLKGKVGIKISTGEAGNPNYLKPVLIRDLVKKLNGIIVECNTAYPGKRNNIEDHMKVIEDHGFLDIAKVDIMDAYGEKVIPVSNGKHLSTNRIGITFDSYNSFLALSHFKGHPVAGFGGALKNISIGFASRTGKKLIHTAGKSDETIMGGEQIPFLESMAEAAKSIVDYVGRQKILFINVMNNMSIDCDCVAHPKEVKMDDIGICASLDPVALDQACIDFIYMAPDNRDMIRRIESRNGLNILQHAEEIGLGSRRYNLIDLDEDVSLEAKINAEDRKNLDESEFGLPAQRKYPLHDKSHVMQAIRMFNYCYKADRPELANNIIKAMHKHMTPEEIKNINIGNNNTFAYFWNKHTEKSEEDEKRKAEDKNNPNNESTDENKQSVREKEKEAISKYDEKSDNDGEAHEAFFSINITEDTFNIEDSIVEESLITDSIRGFTIINEPNLLDFRQIMVMYRDDESLDDAHQQSIQICKYFKKHPLFKSKINDFKLLYFDDLFIPNPTTYKVFQNNINDHIRFILNKKIPGYNKYTSKIQKRLSKGDDHFNLLGIYESDAYQNISDTIFETLNTYVKNNPKDLVLIFGSNIVSDHISNAKLISRGYPYAMDRINIRKWIKDCVDFISNKVKNSIRMRDMYNNYGSSKYPIIIQKINNKIIKYLDLYHISPDPNIKEMKPRIPRTAMYYENHATPRISFAPSIKECIYAVPTDTLYNDAIYVYRPVITEDTFGYMPTSIQVPDVSNTHEIWILNDIQVRLVGVIKPNENRNGKYKLLKGNLVDTLDDYKLGEDNIEPTNESSLAAAVVAGGAIAASSAYIYKKLQNLADDMEYYDLSDNDVSKYKRVITGIKEFNMVLRPARETVAQQIINMIESIDSDKFKSEIPKLIPPNNAFKYYWDQWQYMKKNKEKKESEEKEARESMESIILPFAIPSISNAISNFKDAFNAKFVGKFAKNLLSVTKDINKLSPMKEALTIGVKVTKEDNTIIISGVNFRRFMIRYDRCINSKKIFAIFDLEYLQSDYNLYMRKKITKKNMRIVKLKFNQFFALEVFNIFALLEDEFGDPAYVKICQELLKLTWIGGIKTTSFKPIDLSKLNTLNYTPEEYQKEFINSYPTLKSVLNLDGYILAFEQGLGKTFTSIALSICLDKDNVFILCPKKLMGNWKDEITKYLKRYNDNVSLADEEIFIFDTNIKSKPSNNCKYYITNYENAKALLPYVKNNNYMIIIDESHNFRNVNGSKLKDLIKLKEKYNCKDVLLCSGTPIKAIPSEITPSLLLIDPIFDMDSARAFSKAFNISNEIATDILRTRFGYIMYRKDKSSLNLPDKVEESLYVTINKPDKYGVNEVKKEVSFRFKELYEEKVSHNKEKKDIFVKYVNMYNNAPPNITKIYMDKIVDPANSQLIVDMHESEKDLVSGYVEKYVFPNVPQEKLKDVKRAHSDYIRMRQSAIGSAIGEILVPRRSEMYIEMWNENREKFIKMIEDNPKKTVIFSQFKPVVNHIYKDLNENGIMTVKITGDIKDGYDTIKMFKEDENVEVIIATSQSMGTGQTLTQADQMFFFGPPWRSSDYDQCCDRIHRIGQTTDCHIYNVLLKTEYGNLSTRMDSILTWSQNMFDSYIINALDNQDNEIQKIITESLIDSDNSDVELDISFSTLLNQID